MIKVVFTYQTKTSDLPELMEKFQQSASSEFNGIVNNLGINQFKRSKGDQTVVVLDIYYETLSDYDERTTYERSLDAWNDIWFNPTNKHKELSVEVFEVLNKAF
ncbi:hypothetical protein CKN86_07975 [Carnobacterium divergens]|uniref:hypothetical protein n=1 Tax=Carnobacterium divergens TaxID=2748 RepID=UPI0007F48528|nr:hypothetical protein [Carnobacterium divergens]MCO6017958.1 hypothetical protein [Carnobacterium divergens]MPQ21171.1 hypothetical protein [Carnobacterium divergens]TFI61789.1 hypothetical protein CKN62_08115 [Carnobacterium divergens]TFI89061.1 hypothetical protein CKN84_08005 [Carnobacterium divergens]TFJ03214.1 hypothetical protein CKN86_07975 [Carnobacterium divergens]